ncbi:MAG: response regulator [SAR324 cluster bacterium]|nr:response regulator [SAR324 cluster bacterium]
MDKKAITEKTKVLLVDDKPENLMALESLLATNFDLNCLQATSGNEALKLAAIHDLALILLDVQMPEMDGFETAEILRSVRETRQIPIIFVTAISRDQEQVFKGYESGAVDYLFKPINSYILKSKVKVFVELNQQKQRLEQRANDLELLNQKLHQMQAELLQSRKMEALGTLAGGIAHEFNNLLFAMIGYTELVRDELPEDTLNHKNLEKVLNAGKRAKDLIDQILAFSHKTPFVRKQIQIYPIIKDVIQLMQITLPANIDIQQEIRAEEGSVMADITQLHQVLMNLCTNAAHAMLTTGGTLTIGLNEVMINGDFAAKHGLQEGAYCQLSVRDTGRGIAPEIIDRVFDPFFTTKALNTGTGMGLSVVHGIITQCGGSISVQSELGKGTVFDIFLPKAETEVPEHTNSTSPSLQGKESILLVDDEQLVAHMLAQRLKRLGYQVTTILSSKEALSLVMSSPDHFDLILTDQSMPDLSGIQLAKALLQHKIDLPILLLTGYGDAVTLKKAKEIGIRDCLMKPVDLAQLTKSIRSALNQ